MPQCQTRVFYLPDYSINLARRVAQGADLWLNTPEVGYEACGTSGMKSGLNGALQFSTNDGWYAEVDWDNMGWLLPEDNIKKNLYTILATQVAPLYYERENNIPKKWIGRMRKTMELVSSQFTSARMLKDYYEKLYFPTA